MKKLIIYFFILPLYVFGGNGADSNPEIDSLLQVVEVSENPQAKVDLYNKIAFQYLFIDTLKAIEYVGLAKQVSKENNYSQGIARAINIHAIHHSFQGRNVDGIKLNKEALSYCKEDDHFVKGKIYNGLGLAYQRRYIVDSCLENYHKALFHASEAKDTMTMAVVLGNLAGVNSGQENNKEARKYFLQLEKVASNFSNHNIQFAFNFRFGEFLSVNDEYEESNKYLEQALINAKTLKHNSKIRKVQLQLAINSINSGNYELADTYLSELISTNLEPDDHTFMRYHYWKSELEFERKNYRQVIYHANICLEKIVKNEKYYFHMPLVLDILQKSESYLNNHESAYNYLLELKTWNDSLDLKKREDKFVELEKKYQSEKKEMENAVLLEQTNSKTIKLQQRTTLAIGSLLTLLLSLLVGFMFYRNSKKEKLANALLESRVEERTKKLKKSNEELERFAYIVSHDLKEPVRNITGFTNLLRRKLSPSQKFNEVEQYIEFIEKSSNQMLFLVDGILDYTKLGKDVAKTTVDLNEVLGKVELYLHQLISSKNAKIISHNLPSIYCNPILIFQIFKNLIENGIKFNESTECIIEINCVEDSDHLTLKFIDNGIGIDENYQDQIFEMFSRLNKRSEYDGSGLGLSIVKKLTGLMDGEITLSSSSNLGTTFTLKIPKSNVPSIDIAKDMVVLQ